LLIDAAQTAGAVPIDVEEMEVDLLAFTGHKSLLGPTGTGGLYIRDGVNVALLIRGGTGSLSSEETQPEFFPDAHESGTPNVAGILGLGAGVRYIQNFGIENVRAKEMDLMRRFLAGAASIPGLIIYGPAASIEERTGTVSFNISGAVPSEVGSILENSFGILSRTGLHCAPAAHRTIGTFPQGTVRFSFGPSNTPAEIEIALAALQRISEWAAKTVAAHGGRI
jgi:selenocysteine lyase/cysteine desulfurase